MTEVEQLKYWLDTELTLNHMLYAVILGVLIGGRFWFVVGAYIFICLIYASKRAAILPKNYLSTAGKHRP